METERILQALREAPQPIERNQYMVLHRREWIFFRKMGLYIWTDEQLDAAEQGDGLIGVMDNHFYKTYCYITIKIEV